MALEAAADQSQLIIDPRLNTTGRDNVTSIFSHRNHGLSPVQVRESLKLFGISSFDEDPKPGQGLEHLTSDKKQTEEQQIAAGLLILAWPVILISGAHLAYQNPEIPRKVNLIDLGRTEDEYSYEYLRMMTMFPDAKEREAALVEKTGLSYSQIKHEFPALLQQQLELRGARRIRDMAIDDLPALMSVLKGRLALVGPHPYARSEESSLEGLIGSRLARTRSEMLKAGVKPALAGPQHAIIGGRSLPPEPRAFLEDQYMHRADANLDARIRNNVPVKLLNGGVSKVLGSVQRHLRNSVQFAAR